MRKAVMDVSVVLGLTKGLYPKAANPKQVQAMVQEAVFRYNNAAKDNVHANHVLLSMSVAAVLRSV